MPSRPLMQFFAACLVGISVTAAAQSDAEHARLLQAFHLANSPTGESAAAAELEELQRSLYARQESLISLYVQACWIYRIRKLSEPDLTPVALAKRNDQLDPHYMLNWARYLWTREGKSQLELATLEPWFSLQLTNDPETAKQREGDGKSAANAVIATLRKAKATVAADPDDREARHFIARMSFENGLFSVNPATAPQHPSGRYNRLRREVATARAGNRSELADYYAKLKAHVAKTHPEAKLNMLTIQQYASPEQRQRLLELRQKARLDTARNLRPALLSRIADAQEAYASALKPAIAKEYRNRLAKLDDNHVLLIQKARRTWLPYLQQAFPGGSKSIWRDEFLAPVDRIRELLHVDTADLADETIAAQRRDLLADIALLDQCDRILDLSRDPVAGMKSPTGIDIPTIDQPQTPKDALLQLERTLAMTAGYADPAARPLLMQNLENAKIFDVNEFDFVASANEIRMLMGQVAWLGDPLLTAAARDHSIDRKAGRASGHMSQVEGKRGFVDRALRMGARRPGSEGAGGGRTGAQALRGFSYSGTGHGGPLYSRVRNVVGAGMHQGACTAKYATDKSLLHSAPALDGYAFLPPGFTTSDVPGSLRSVADAIANQDFGATLNRLRSFQPRNQLETIFHRFFLAYFRAEAEYQTERALAIYDAGDVYRAQQILQDANREFRGSATFEELAAPLSAKLVDPANAEAIRAGLLFYQLLEQAETRDANLMKTIALRCRGSAYAAAAEATLANPDFPNNKADPRAYFAQRNPVVGKYDYPNR